MRKEGRGVITYMQTGTPTALRLRASLTHHCLAVLGTPRLAFSSLYPRRLRRSRTSYPRRRKPITASCINMEHFLPQNTQHVFVRSFSRLSFYSIALLLLCPLTLLHKTPVHSPNPTQNQGEGGRGVLLILILVGTACNYASASIIKWWVSQ